MGKTMCVLCKKSCRVTFKVPKDELKWRRWNASCSVNFKQGDCVCERHFSKEDFIHPPGDPLKRARLQPGAVPSLAINIQEVMCNSESVPVPEVEADSGLESCLRSLHKTKKCGEITASTDGRDFGLNCLFCGATYMQLHAFIEHILSLHSTEIVEASEMPKELFDDARAEGNVFIDNDEVEIDYVEDLHDIENVVNKPSPTKNDTIIADEKTKNHRTTRDETSTDSDSFVDNCDDFSLVEKPFRISLSDEQLKKFVEIYKKYPCLWDLDREESRCKKLQAVAQKELQGDVSSILNTELTISELQMLLKKLRTRCTNEKRRHLMGSSKPPSDFYKLFQFMEHCIGPYRCKTCSHVFKSHDKFLIHVAEHDGGKAFDCKICGKDYSTLGMLYQHMRRHGGCNNSYKQTPPPVTLCDICGKLYSSSLHFRKHLRTTHFPNKKYKCTLCSMAYFQKDRYLHHMNAHFNIRSITCDVCGKGFFSNRYLTAHKKTHENGSLGRTRKKRVPMCTICDRRFRCRSRYYLHMRTKHNMDRNELP